MMRKLLEMFALSTLLLNGCSTLRPESFANTKPEFIVEKYLSGKVKAYGLVQDTSGKPIRQFVVDLNGTWDGTVLTLDERFQYSDGKKQTRIWTITKQDEHTYEGKAADVVGVATGRQFGQALNWSYVLRVPVDDTEYDIRFDDWMFLQSDNILINHAIMSKFGFKVGEILIFFSKEV